MRWQARHVFLLRVIKTHAQTAQQLIHSVADTEPTGARQVHQGATGAAIQAVGKVAAVLGAQQVAALGKSGNTRICILRDSQQVGVEDNRQTCPLSPLGSDDAILSSCQRQQGPTRRAAEQRGQVNAQLVRGAQRRRLGVLGHDHQHRPCRGAGVRLVLPAREQE